MLEIKSILRSVIAPAQRQLTTRSPLALLIGLCLTIGVIANLGVLATGKMPQSLEITGYYGHLGEWELTGTLARDATTGTRELSGPVTMTHVGLCSQDGPEQKSGQMRVRFSRLSARINARLLIDGVECTFNGAVADTEIGMMLCPDRRPVPLSLWTK